MESELLSVTALWWAVIFSGIYHGINPGMGWPLAVSAALMEGKASALPRAVLLLALGHLLAMLTILLPFSLMTILVTYEREIRIGAGLIVIAMGFFLLIYNRHPRFLARVHPARLALWSFLAAIAHGAGLMLVPIYLQICQIAPDDTGHLAAQTLMTGNIANALFVSVVHTLAMTLAGGIAATGVYYWFGLKSISKSWFNLDRIWALSLILVGAFGIWAAITH